MATSIATAGPGALSGEIKFSQLRKFFLKMNQRNTFSDSETFDAEIGSVSASELLRDTTGTTPNVPDSTENSNIATTNDWRPSQFRNSVKYYYIQQSGVEINYNIGSQNWNNNLNKNILKKAYIDGTCGSTTPLVSGCRLVTSTKNIIIDVGGVIYGAGGVGAIAGGNGGNGGTALEVSASSNNILVSLRSTSVNIFGGGGGGSGGGRGGAGGNGGAGHYTFVSGHHSNPSHSHPGCPGAPGHPCPQGGNNRNRHGVFFNHHPGNSGPNFSNANTLGGVGGNAGNAGSGGRGRGYSQNLIGGNSGNLGGPGGNPSPAGNAGPGGPGGPGGSGGSGSDWGTAGIKGVDGVDGTPGTAGDQSPAAQPGGSAATAGSAGAAGASITGSGYNYTGVINTSGSNITVRGPIIGGTLI